MKVLILAAGSGSRMRSISAIPKPLIRVKNRPLIWWALKTFHDSMTQGLIRKTDIRVAVLREYIEDFRSDPFLKNFFDVIDPFIIIEKVTEGPVQTAFIAVNKLLTSTEFQTNESLVISDADHFAQSPNIARGLTKIKGVHLWETKKRPDDLSWCFLSDKDNQRKLIEKPIATSHINVNRGIVGIYGFSSVATFRNCAESIIKGESKREIFLSDVVNQLLDSGNNLNVYSINNFYPLGNPDQLAAAVDIPEPHLNIFDVPTFFVDVDGVTLLHNQSVHGSEVHEEDKVIEKSKVNLREMWENGRIILVTARPDYFRNHLIKTLKKYEINYDFLQMGVTGGARFLINDLKPHAWFLNTAIAKNVIRDLPWDLPKVWNPTRDLSGGSGALTILLTNGNEKIVCKSSTSPSQTNILNYQATWYEYVKNNLNVLTATVIDKRFIGENFVFYTEFMPDLIKFSDYIETTDFNSSGARVLCESFGNLYSFTHFDSGKNYDLLPDIFRLKVLPSIESLAKSFQEDSAIQQLVGDIIALLTLKMTKDLFESFPFQGDKSVIHGDPTFENLHIDISKNAIVFLDPVGKLIEPKFTQSSNQFFSYPVFDLARLELSFKYKYEELSHLVRGSNLPRKKIYSLASETLMNKSILDTPLADTFKKFYTENLVIVLITTIGRILKYKKEVNEVLLLLLQLKEILQDFNS